MEGVNPPGRTKFLSRKDLSFLCDAVKDLPDSHILELERRLWHTYAKEPTTDKAPDFAAPKNLQLELGHEAGKVVDQLIVADAANFELLNAKIQEIVGVGLALAWIYVYQVLIENLLFILRVLANDFLENA
ncbi:MAG: hypothetical protein ACRD35_00395, partial [Candidatus Acidiferrales bacterium]